MITLSLLLVPEYPRHCLFSLSPAIRYTPFSLFWFMLEFYPGGSQEGSWRVLWDPPLAPHPACLIFTHKNLFQRGLQPPPFRLELFPFLGGGVVFFILFDLKFSNGLRSSFQLISYPCPKTLPVRRPLMGTKLLRQALRTVLSQQDPAWHTPRQGSKWPSQPTCMHLTFFF